MRKTILATLAASLLVVGAPALAQHGETAGVDEPKAGDDDFCRAPDHGGGRSPGIEECRRGDGLM